MGTVALVTQSHLPKGGRTMLTETQSTSIKYIKILSVLRQLAEDGTISKAEYIRAKKYYQKLTGADLVIAD